MHHGHERFVTVLLDQGKRITERGAGTLGREDIANKAGMRVASAIE